MNALEIGGAGVCVAALGSMVRFAFVKRSRPADANLASRPHSALFGRWLREWVVWFLAPLERAAVTGEVAPETFNWLGLVFGAGAGAAFAAGALAAGGWLLLVSGVTDVLDGRVARARGMASPFGAFLDSTLDRFVEAICFVGLVWYFRSMPAGALASSAALAGSLLVSYTRARGQGLGVDCPRGALQRPERVVLLAVAALADRRVTAAVGWPPGTVIAWGAGFIALGSIATAIYRTAAIGRALRRGSRRNAGPVPAAAPRGRKVL